MGISSYLAPISTKAQIAWEKTTKVISHSRAWTKAVAIKNHLAAKAMEKTAVVWQKIENTETWRNKIKPVYDGYLKPGFEGIKSLKDKAVTGIKNINKKDAKTIGGGLTLSAAITSLAIMIFGAAVIPLAFMAGTGTMLVSTYNVHERIRRERNEKAWGRLDRLRRHVHVITHNNRKLDPIHHQLKKLELDPDFKHIKEDIKQVKLGLDNVTKALRRPDYEEYKASLLELIKGLKNIPILAPLLARINAFETNIGNAGTRAYVRKEAVKFMMDLNQSRLPEGIKTNLKSEFIKLDNALSKQRLGEVKQNYKTEIETLMRKLIPDWDIPKLGPGDVPVLDEEENREIPAAPPEPAPEPAGRPAADPPRQVEPPAENNDDLDVRLDRIADEEDLEVEVQRQP